MNIALDAMGGDRAPAEIVQGAVLAAHEYQHTITLVGDPSQIEALLPKPVPRNLVIHPASQCIAMDEKPVEAIRKKRDSSLVVAIEMVRDGIAQAVVTAGNTGAATAAALLSWRQLPGVHRPAIASTFPRHGGFFVLLDAGASPDVDPEHLVEFALMGRAYSERVLGQTDPRVRLLNIGEEPGKGSAFARNTYALMSHYPWFDGNIEGKDLFREPCDVVVCDAFVGNIVLKTTEGVAEFIMSLFREALPKSKLLRLAYLPLLRALAPLRKKMDYAEYGGSPLLGLNGLCMICHGRSNAKAIYNALMSTQTAVDNKLIESLRQHFGHGQTK